MSDTTRPAALALLAALVLAACGSGASATPPPDASGDGTTPTATADGGGTEPTPDDGTGGGGTDADNPYADPELAARFPAEVDGVPFTITTIDYAKGPLELAGQSFMGGEGMEDWLAGTGKTWQDVRWGVASADTADTAITMTISAVRVVGATGDALGEWFGLSGNTFGDGGTTATIGGREVAKYEVPGLDLVVYQWVDGDTLFWATGGPEAFADKVVAAID